MSGFTNGFRTGFSTVNTLERQSENDRRYNDQTARNDERYQAGVTRQNTMDEMTKTTFDNQQADRVVAQADKKKNDARTGVLQGREDVLYQQGQRNNKYNNVMQQVSNAYQANPNGENITTQNYLDWQAEAKGTNAEVLFDVTKQEAGQYLVAQMQSGFEGADAEGIKQATNTYLSSQINRKLAEGVVDKSGVPIADMAFESWEPTNNGGLIAHVKVTNQNGESYVAPVTKLRSADDDDPIRLYNAEKLFNHLIAENQLINTLNKGGFLSKLNAPNRVSSSESTPAKVHEIKAMAKAMNISEGDAWKLDQQKDNDPGKMKTLAFKSANDSWNDPYAKATIIDTPQGPRQATPEETKKGLGRPVTQQDIKFKADGIYNYLMGGQGVTQQSQQQPQGGLSQQKQQALAQAQSALSQGAPQDKVIAMLQKHGFTKAELAAL